MTPGPSTEDEREFDRLLDETRELRSEVVATSARLSATADTLDRVLTELQSKGEPGWRVVAWYASCLVLMASALVAVVHGAAGFGTLAPTTTATSAVQLAVATEPGAASLNPFGADSFYIAAEYAQGSTDGTTYTLWFPRTLAGRDFALLLLGSAALDDARGVTGAITTRSSTCVVDATSTLAPRKKAPVKAPCQMIQGRVPSTTPDSVPIDCSLSPLKRPQYAAFEISGRTDLTTRPDWAHEVTQVPSLSGDRFGAVTLDTWNGLPLGREMGTATQEACKRLNKKDAWQLSTVTPEPSFFTSDQFIWSGDKAASPDVVVFKARDAQGDANLWIAGAGAAIALGVGFLPVAYESGREWLRGRRRQRAVADAEADTPSR